MVGRPGDWEEENFARIEFRRKKKAEEEKQEKIAVVEKKKVRDLHYMKCPKCGMELIEIDYRGIKIDRCSACEGVWLDAGELETISNFEKTGMDRFFYIFKR